MREFDETFARRELRGLLDGYVMPDVDGSADGFDNSGGLNLGDGSRHGVSEVRRSWRDLRVGRSFC